MRNTPFYKFLSGFLNWFGTLMIAFRQPRVKAEHIRKALEIAKPGLIICRRFTYYLDAYFIRGKYTHSGLVISDKDMIHAVSGGVEYVDIIDYIKDCDGFVILQPPYKNKEDIARIINFKKGAVDANVPYDYLFDKKDDRAFYCNELIWRAFKSVGMEMPVKRRIVYAEDVINFCEVIYETPF